MIFSRRSIQRALFALAPSLKASQVKELRNLLERGSVAHEWQVIYSAALAAVGRVKCEPAIVGARSPLDVVFEGPGDLCFAADVTAVSDEYATRQNPVDEFHEKINAASAKIAHRVGGVRLQVDNAHTPTDGRRLALPPRHLIDEIMRSHIRPFFRAIAAAPRERKTLRYEDRDNDVAFTLTSVPNTPISELRHPTYTSPLTAKKNALYNALHKKAGQLRRSAWPGLRGVVVCDAGCDTLRRGPAEPVLRSFFRSHRNAAHFIHILSIEDGDSPTVRSRVYWNPFEAPADKRRVEDVLEQGVAALPPIARTPLNAEYMRRSPRAEDGSFYGGYTLIGDRKIKISARTVLRLLSGDLKYEEFRAGHTAPLHAELRDQLRDGRRIESVEIEHSSNADDDWIVLTFGEHDAAYGPFPIPGDSDAGSTPEG